VHRRVAGRTGVGGGGGGPPRRQADAGQEEGWTAHEGGHGQSNVCRHWYRPVSHPHVFRQVWGQVPMAL
jgi:hypothetical protein